jgi:hypothetical protein
MITAPWSCSRHIVYEPTLYGVAVLCSKNDTYEYSSLLTGVHQYISNIWKKPKNEKTREKGIVFVAAADAFGALEGAHDLKLMH